MNNLSGKTYLFAMASGDVPTSRSKPHCIWRRYFSTRNFIPQKKQFEARGINAARVINRRRGDPLEAPSLSSKLKAIKPLLK